MSNLSVVQQGLIAVLMGIAVWRSANVFLQGKIPSILAWITVIIIVTIGSF